MIGANLLTKATNLFMKQVSAKGGTIRKADEPMEPVPVHDGTDQPDEDALIQECIESLDKGELTADPEKVAEWAKTKGMSDEAAADFAEAVLSAYFDEGETEAPAPEGEEPAAEEGVETVEETAKAIAFWSKSIDQKLKKLQSIESNMTTLVKGMSSLMEVNSQLAEENRIFKASMEKMGITPASKPAVIQKAAPIKSEEISFGEAKKIVLKGAIAGSLNPSEVAAWESTYGRIQSENIKKYIQENK
ncbi:MAG TPA: hypothetical protein PKK05_18105 [Leptospiraceae bacterium]|nr:hypothetical protein [Leptospiraceae bacterium]